MSLKTFLYSTLLAATALAGSSGGFGGGGGSGGGGGGSYGGSYGGSGSPSASPSGGDSGGSGWSTWGSGGSGGQGPPAFAAASCPSGCSPLQTGGPPPPLQTQPGQLIVQVVSVSDANGSLKYFPNAVTAPVGSIVQFQYHPKNHTVTESSFAVPCKPIAANLTTPTRPGLKSGFVPVTGQEPFTPVFNVLVNDTKPIWIYCGQVNHCEKGMAMVINQNVTSGKTIDAYISAAAQIPLVSVAAAPPPAGTPPPPPPPPPGTSAPPFAFGGGSPPPASSSFAPPPPVQTVAPASATTGAVAPPAVFTGAAVPGYVPQSSSGVAGLVLGALLALW